MKLNFLLDGHSDSEKNHFREVYFRYLVDETDHMLTHSIRNLESRAKKLNNEHSVH